MSILITGGSGFIGHNLVEYFLAKKYSILYPSRKELNLTDSESVEKYLKSNTIETIVHCATTRLDGKNYPSNTCEMNLRMFFNLQKYKNPSTKLINLGSGSEYARAYWHKKMPEEYYDTHTPNDGHSYAKYLISKYIKQINKKDLICLRIFGIYGRYEDYRYKFISNAIVKNILKLPIVINQNVIYDYLYITDFCRIMEHFVNNNVKNVKNKIFNVCPTKSIDLITIANIINKVSGYESEIRVLNARIGVEYSGDNKKLLSEIGNFKFVSQENAIADLFKYYSGLKDTLDVAAIKKDSYLQYAEKLCVNYFSKKNEK
jgi:GDP-L-fucose synthase